MIIPTWLIIYILQKHYNFNKWKCISQLARKMGQCFGKKKIPQSTNHDNSMIQSNPSQISPGPTPGSAQGNVNSDRVASPPRARDHEHVRSNGAATRDGGGGQESRRFHPYSQTNRHSSSSPGQQPQQHSQRALPNVQSSEGQRRSDQNHHHHHHHPHRKHYSNADGRIQGGSRDRQKILYIPPSTDDLVLETLKLIKTLVDK